MAYDDLSKGDPNQIMPHALRDCIRGTLLGDGRSANVDACSELAEKIVQSLHQFGWEVRPRDQAKR